MNVTLNLSNFSIPGANACEHLGKLDLGCIYRTICEQKSAAFAASGLALIIAFFVVDLVLPLILARLKPDLSGLKASYPLLFGNLPDLTQASGRAQANAWLKARLLWAFVLWAAYQLWI
jgi:hypothetical protein